jgi:subtilisin family serine protease
MQPRISYIALAAGLLLSLAVAVAATAAPGEVPIDSSGKVPLVLTGRSQDALAAHVAALGGVVEYRFESAPLLAVRVPAEKLPELLADARLERAERQRLVRRAVSEIDVPGIGRLPGGMRPLRDLGPSRVRTLTPAELASAAARGDTVIVGDTFLGYEAITGAEHVWERANFGAGVIVVVIDTGIYPDHPLIAGSVIGGFNLVPAEEEQLIDADGDSLADGHSFDWNALGNDSHGTSVSGLLAGHAELLVKKDSRLAEALALYAPTTLTEVPDDTSQVAVRLLGTAPAASLYGIKVFPYDGGESPDARVAEALDRVVKMKRSGELATDVVNMSLGGPSLWDGHGVLDQVVDVATDEGITVVVAAGNEGPALVSTGSPANAFSALAIGAAADPLHTRVAIEQFFTQGPVGSARLVYPYDALQMANFSGRGRTADGRVKPDLSATGFLNFTGFLIDQNGDGVNDDVDFGIGAGTSFACPIAAGGAALLTAYGRMIGDHGRAPYVANALMGAAEPIADFDRVPEIGQGKGYLVLPRAFDLLDTGAWNPPPRSDANALTERLDLGNEPFVQNTCPPLGPGESFTYVLRVPRSATKIEFSFPEVTPGEKQNPVLGDQLQITLHSAKRGGSGDYVFQDSAIDPGDTYTYEAPEPGAVRLTFTAGFTNVSPITGSFTAQLTTGPPNITRTFGRTLEHNGVFETTFDVPKGLELMTVTVLWAHNWTEHPTYDLDCYLVAPDSTIDVSGATLNSPERVEIAGPVPGTWGLRVVDAGTVPDREWFRVVLAFTDSTAAVDESSREAATTKAGEERVVLAFQGATPNPTRADATIRFTTGSGGPVSIAIYDVAGRLVRRLGDGPLAPGEHALAWDGRDDQGRAVAAGVYLIRIAVPGGTATHKLLLAR